MRRENNWHARPANHVLAALESSHAGLSDQEATARLEKYGANRIPEAPNAGFIDRFVPQFHDTLIYVLLVAGLATMAFGHRVDASVIFAVVLVNAIIGWIQEGKAESALLHVPPVRREQGTAARIM